MVVIRDTVWNLLEDSFLLGCYAAFWRYLFANRPGITSQQTCICTSITVRTSDLAQISIYPLSHCSSTIAVSSLSVCRNT